MAAFGAAFCSRLVSFRTCVVSGGAATQHCIPTIVNSLLRVHTPKTQQFPGNSGPQTAMSILVSENVSLVVVNVGVLQMEKTREIAID